MTQLLPGPEDVGKHLFEIRPGRPEHLAALCWDWSWWPQWGCCHTVSLGRAEPLHEIPVLSLNMTRKFGPNLEDFTNLGGN